MEFKKNNGGEILVENINNNIHNNKPEKAQQLNRWKRKQLLFHLISVLSSLTTILPVWESPSKHSKDNSRKHNERLRTGWSLVWFGPSLLHAPLTVGDCNPIYLTTMVGINDGRLYTLVSHVM